MDHGERSELIRVLSPDRFSTYLSAAAGDEDLAFRLYEWNDSCSEIFVRPLRWLEVALRNALHAEMTRLVGRPDWWEKRSLLLTDVHRRMIDEAVERLRRNGKRVKDGRVVAELSFGFWVGLLGPGRNYEMVLWRPALRHAFGGYRATRKELHHASRARQPSYTAQPFGARRTRLPAGSLRGLRGHPAPLARTE